jgi:hypothetical protein
MPRKGCKISDFSRGTLFKSRKRRKIERPKKIAKKYA